MLLNNKKMTNIEKIKIIFENFIKNRVRNYHRLKKKSKAFSYYTRKYGYYFYTLDQIKKLKKK